MQVAETLAGRGGIIIIVVFSYDQKSEGRQKFSAPLAGYGLFLMFTRRQLQFHPYLRTDEKRGRGNATEFHLLNILRTLILTGFTLIGFNPYSKDFKKDLFLVL